jgi:hypothetical protein
MDHARRRSFVALDSGADYLLGLPMLMFPRHAAALLGLPEEQSTFYQRVLGGVLTGLATASAIEYRRSAEGEPVGLGVGGAVAVNAFGGGAVALWLAASSDAAALPRRGRALLWGVASGVLAIGAIEAWNEWR